jgi:hypothetical protein
MNSHYKILITNINSSPFNAWNQLLQPKKPSIPARPKADVFLETRSGERVLYSKPLRHFRHLTYLQHAQQHQGRQVQQEW